MNEYFKKIADYLESEDISYDYDAEQSMMIFYISSGSSEQKIKGVLKEIDKIFIVYISVKIDFDCEEYKYKIYEYFHRANLGMIRGNFEFNPDLNIIRFKHYFEKTIVSDKDYTLYNILLPINMCSKYLQGIIEIVDDSKSPKEIIVQIESESSQVEEV